MEIGDKLSGEEFESHVKRYWTARTKDFNTVRMNVLQGDISERWMSELNVRIPKDRELDILDAGTGTGYFAVLLAKEGHHVTGIDLTESMIEAARETALQFGVMVSFLQMDVQETTFEDNSFDVIVSRNVTWTLSDPERAYREWYRILKPGGVILNFDANYAENVRNGNQKESRIKPEDVYGHIGMTKELSEENARISLSAPAGSHLRPQWDTFLAEKIGFTEWGSDDAAGRRVLMEKDLSDAPLFLFWAKK